MLRPQAKLIPMSDDVQGSKLSVIIQLLSAAKGKNLSDAMTRKLLNKPEIQQLRDQLREAGVIVRKSIGSGPASDIISWRGFTAHLLKYVDGWMENAPKNSVIPPPLQVSVHVDPRTTFKKSLAGSFIHLLQFMQAVLAFGSILAVQGEYSVANLIFYAGKYARLNVAQRALDVLSKFVS